MELINNLDKGFDVAIIGRIIVWITLAMETIRVIVPEKVMQ